MIDDYLVFQLYLIRKEYWDLKSEWWDSVEIQNDEDFKEQKIRIGCYYYYSYIMLKNIIAKEILFYFNRKRCDTH